MDNCLLNLNREPEVGQTYKVPCALVDKYFPAPDKMTPMMWVPLLDPESHDDQTPLGEHYHIDSRFYDEEPILAGMVLPVSEVRKIEDRELLCVRASVDFKEVPKKAVGDLEERYKGAKITTCQRCPHKGTYLGNCSTAQEIIVCPAHGLRFEAKTGVVTTRKRMEVDQPEGK